MASFLIGVAVMGMEPRFHACITEPKLSSPTYNIIRKDLMTTVTLPKESVPPSISFWSIWVVFTASLLETTTSPVCGNRI